MLNVHTLFSFNVPKPRLTSSLTKYAITLMEHYANHIPSTIEQSRINNNPQTTCPRLFITCPFPHHGSADISLRWQIMVKKSSRF